MITALLIKRKYKEVVVAYCEVMIKNFSGGWRKITRTFLKLADLCSNLWDRNFRKYRSWSL